jgi:hypothetical protein
MKHFLIAGLIAAIGAVALVSTAHAASRYCYYNPDDPDCFDQGGYGDGGDPVPPPPPRRPLYDNGYDQNDYGEPYYPPRPPRPVYQPASECETIGASLRRYGYRRIRAVDCDGRFFEYNANRGNRRFLVKVNSNTGRIVNEIRR